MDHSPNPKEADAAQGSSTVRKSKSMESTAASRSREHPLPAGLPTEVAALASMTPRERVLFEWQAKERARQEQAGRCTFRGRYSHAIKSNVQTQRKQELETEREQHILSEHQKEQRRLAAASASEAQAKLSKRLSQPSVMYRSKVGRFEFQLGAFEGTVPPFVLTQSAAERAPPVGHYGTSISVATPRSTVRQPLTPRGGSEQTSVHHCSSCPAHVDPLANVSNSLPSEEPSNPQPYSERTPIKDSPEASVDPVVNHVNRSPEKVIAAAAESPEAITESISRNKSRRKRRGNKSKRNS